LKRIPPALVYQEVASEGQIVWARNLLFLGLVGSGVLFLGANLFPPAVPGRSADFDPAAAEAADFRAAVKQVNTAVHRQWTRHELRPAPKASDLAIARRLSLALTGTIPSLQEIRQFEAQPKGQRIAWYLAGIFQDRRYADYLAERLARAFVGTEDGPFLIFRRRRLVAWLSDELHANRPYDQVVRELIGANGLWTDQPASNFLTVTSEANKNNQPNANRLASRVTRAFLGVRLDCAQCHNHPFEPRWKQSTFQGLAAFFGQTRLGLTGIHDDDKDYAIENRKTGKPELIKPGVPFLSELLPPGGSRRERLAHWITHPNNPYFARATVNRVWALLFGRPLVDPIDDLADAADAEVLNLLAADFAGHNYDLQRLVRVIAASDVFQRASAAGHRITVEHESYGAVFPLTRLRPEQVVGSVLQAASLETINQQSHIIMKILRSLREKEFVKRYGDTGEDEFAGRGETIPQRLLLMNGNLVKETTRKSLFNAATRIGWLASDDRRAVETAYLVLLTRRPTPREMTHFLRRLAGTHGEERSQRMEDIFWVLINSTEFSWNH
jgi:hypothetical protein